MEIELQTFSIPAGGRIVKNEFTTYDPEEYYTEELNLFYLQEDLLQIEFKELDLVVDLGWYGEIWENKGEFRVVVIKNYDWENPIHNETSKSQKLILAKLENILLNIDRYEK